MFRLGDSSFGVDTAVVRGVMKMREVVPCDRAGSPVSGLVKIRGRAVPVYDVAGLLGSPRSKKTSKSRLIVAEGEYGALAFVVDEVTRSVKNPLPVSGRALVEMREENGKIVDIGERLSQAHLI